MSDLLGIGASGLKAYSSALSTVSDNIANSQTIGYARRSVTLAETPIGGNNMLYRNNVRPGGVLVTGIDRAVDEWLVADARISGSDAGRTSSRLNWVEAAERSFIDGQGGISVHVTDIFNKADQLTADPSNTTLRNQFLASIDQAATSFRQTAVGLESVAGGILADAQGSVTQLNTDLAALNRVNDGLIRARDGSTNQASLLDERDRLIDQISSSVAVTATFDAKGAATIKMAGPGGDTLVAGPSVAQFSVTQTADGQIGFILTPSTGGTVSPISGKLAGLVQASTHVAAQRSKLDTMANQLASDLNTAHQAGFDAQGNPGVALMNANSGAISIAAIALSASDVAAANGSSSNGNMLAMSNLRGAGGVETGLAAMIASQSQATAAARAQDAAAATRRDGAFSARDAISAVDLDREAAELIRFQQAYEAAARVIQVARETMQTILNVF